MLRANKIFDFIRKVGKVEFFRARSYPLIIPAVLKKNHCIVGVIAATSRGIPSCHDKINSK